jgi:DNA phosphorothioation-associated putative methyltransferase
MSLVGKRVGDDLYVHVSAIERLAADEHSLRLAEELAGLPVDVRGRVNVAKINIRSQRISWLEYLDFERDPFPALVTSWSAANGGEASLTRRSYSESLNPPVLHRKELLVGSAHPDFDRWSQVTTAAEQIGLFDDAGAIGFQINWRRAIAAAGYALIDDQFVPVGNATADSGGGDDEANGPHDGVRRHLTALARTSLSAPVQQLLRHGLLTAERTFFDYGCGRGGDVSSLMGAGFNAAGWDPHYAPDHAKVSADVVNLGFVINVIEDPAERVEVLHRAFGLTNGVLAVSVMLYGQDTNGRPYGDGVITTRGTFQKYFSQAELKDLLEHALHQQVFPVGPGIALVFADKTLEQRFVVGRYRRRDIGTRLLQLRAKASPRVRERPGPRLERDDLPPPAPHPLLEELWQCALDLGRYPEDVEAPVRQGIVAEFGSLGRALRKLERCFDMDLLEQARAARTEDLRLYFAIQQFSKRPRYRELEPRLQRDIKAFFGDYGSAQASGMRLLMEAADSAALLAACRDAAEQGLGSLDGEHDLQLHVSLVDRLPAVLRAYVACGVQLYGALSEVDLVKIHIASGKLSLMQFEDFLGSAVPAMRRRVKVNIRRASYEAFEYGTQFAMPLLYLKSRYMNEEMAGYAEQAAFDDALAATGLLGQNEFGPSAEELARELRRRRLEISGFRLVRSTAIPDLDEPCGARFSFRQFVECGETQARQSLPNRPLNPETFNALYDLATKVLEPVIDYFGAIRLTYGFCSPALAKHIKGRIAPELDQHAAHETKRNGELVCTRGGAACDFIVDDEDMREVAQWILANVPVDRLYFYSADRPLHVSYAPSESGEAFEMVKTASGRVVPRRFAAAGQAALSASR